MLEWERFLSLPSTALAILCCLNANLSEAQDLPQSANYSKDLLFACHIRATLANKGESVYWSDLEPCNQALENAQSLSRAELLATLQNRAILLMELTEFDRARSDLDRAYQLDSESAQIQINLGMLHFIEEDFEEAIEYFSLAAKSQKQRAIALFNRALSFGYSGQSGLALEDLMLLKTEFPQEFSTWVTPEVFPELVTKLEEMSPKSLSAN